MAPRQVLAALAAIAVTQVRVEAIVKELYTTNAVCKQNNCVNPIFPALEELPRLEQQDWVRHNLTDVSAFLSFCGEFVTYNPALPKLSNQTPQERMNAVITARMAGKPIKASDLPVVVNPVQELALNQDKTAAKAYFYHLAGLGMEPWDHTTPAEESAHPSRPCARAVAKMVCYTYFPRAYVDLLGTGAVKYLRPCQSCCENYVKTCNVECCDESVVCAWDATQPGSTAESSPKRTQTTDGKNVLLQFGYAPYDGPSPYCTGDARPRAAGVAVSAIALATALAAVLRTLP